MFDVDVGDEHCVAIARAGATAALLADASTVLPFDVESVRWDRCAQAVDEEVFRVVGNLAKYVQLSARSIVDFG